MRVRLKLNPDKEEATRKELMDLGIEISADADLILTEEKYSEGEIICRENENRIPVSIETILYTESLGKSVFVYTDENKYSATIRLYELERILPPERFIRISNSVIIRRDAIKKIRPGLGQKFYLTLKNDTIVDVTRTYYAKFKEYYGF